MESNNIGETILPADNTENSITLSAVVIAFNEEDDIARCLESLLFAGEIVVVDSHSTDRTEEIARRFTDRVYQRDFTGFSDQKNAAVSYARGEWVLIVDADEVVTDDLADQIRHAVAEGKHDAYWMPRRSFFLGKWIRHCGWYPDRQLRLARRHLAVFEHRLVHETLSIADAGVLSADLEHHTYRDLSEYAAKMVRYARAAAEQKFADGTRFALGDLLFKPTLAFLKMYVVKRGFMDGIRGLMLSVLTACSTAIRYAFLWEIGMRDDGKEESI